MGDPTVVDGVLMRTSPSSIEQFVRCPTAWHLNYVCHAEERVHPTTAFGQRLGQKAHTQLEDLALKGVEPTDPFARALVKYMPARGPDLLIESPTVGLTAAGVPVKGRIDWAHGRLPTRPIIGDWKTRKDLSRYQKTEAELRKDVQMRSYAMWAAIYYPQATSVDVAHYYVETKRHVKKLPDGTLTVFDPGYEPATDRLLVNFPIDETKTFWSTSVSPIVERMKGVAAVPVGQQHTIERPEDMVSRDSPCQMFGGCGRKYACPHSPMNQMRARLGAAKQEQPTMSLASLLAQHSASAAETPKPAVPPSDGIVTADAGSRTNPPPPVRLNEPPKPPPTEQLEAQAHLAEVAASHVDARDPADKALDEKANAEKHEHKYDTTIDGKAACACGRKKPGRTASAPKSEQPQPVVDQGEKAVSNAEYFEKGVANLAQPQPADETSAKQSDRPILLVNCHTPGAVDLTKYVADMATQVAKAAGAADPRFVDKNSPLAYGAWKGALTEHVRNNPPVGRRLMIWTRGDEVAEVVAAALAGVPDIEVVRS